MPISPYSTPIQYEYKPLNLSAFAAPLSEMQQKFDIATEQIDAADFAIENLPYGTDPERAKELIKTVKDKRDELAKNLSETKNYKQATSKLRELNSLWQKDPELNALQSNAKLWAQRDKEERERIDKPNGITRDQYIQWKNDEINKYKKGEGAKFEATAADKEGTYNVITGSTGRLADLDKEFRDLQIEIAKLNPEKSISYFTQNGVSMSPEEKVSFQTTIDSKNAGEIARETEKYLRQIPKFKAWGTEVAKYNFGEKSEYGENLKDVGEPIVKSTLASIDAEIAAGVAEGIKNKKDFKETEDYKSLMDIKEDLTKMSETGEYDPNMIQSLYTQQHLDKLYGSEDIANILAYENTKKTGSVRKNYEWEAAQKAAAAAAEAAAGVVVTPNTEELYTINSINKEKITSSKDLYKTAKNINDISIVRSVIMGKQGTHAYDRLLANSGQIVAKQKQLLGAITTTKNSNGNWQNFKNEANSRGIKMSDKEAKTLWTDMTKEGNLGITQFEQQIQKSEGAFIKYNTAENLLGEIKESGKKTKEYEDVVKNLSEHYLSAPIVESLQRKAANGDKKAQKGYNMFNATSYSAENLKKAGIKNIESLPKTSVNGNWHYTLSVGQVAKLHGYDSTQEAINKGFNFGNVSISPNIGAGVKETKGITLKEGVSVQDLLGDVTQQLYNKGLSKQEMSYRITGSKEVDKVLGGTFLGATDLLNFNPAYPENWAGQPGFSEDGKSLAEGTKLNPNKSPKLAMHGNRVLFEVPIITKGGITTTITVEPKAGMSLFNEKLLKPLEIATRSGGEYNKQVNDMLKVALFNNKFKDNTLSTQLVKSITPDDGQSVSLYKVPFDGNTVLEVRKIQGKDGTDPILKVASVDKNTGKINGFVADPNTGKDWYKNAESNGASDAAKGVMMGILED